MLFIKIYNYKEDIGSNPLEFIRPLGYSQFEFIHQFAVDAIPSTQLYQVKNKMYKIVESFFSFDGSLVLFVTEYKYDTIEEIFNELSTT